MDSDERTRMIEALGRPFPREAIYQRPGARGKMLDYLTTHIVIRRLNEATGNNWDWKITRLEQTGTLLMAMGELTIPGLGTRTGIGVQQVTPGGGEDLAKGVSSDAMKKAATLFGVGLELYGPDVEAAIPERQAGPPHRPTGPAPAGNAYGSRPAQNGAETPAQRQRREWEAKNGKASAAPVASHASDIAGQDDLSDLDDPFKDG